MLKLERMYNSMVRFYICVIFIKYMLLFDQYKNNRIEPIASIL